MLLKEGFTQIRQHMLLVVGLVMLAAGLAWLGWTLTMGTAVEPLIVRTSDVVQTIVASGRVETPARVNIGSQVTGTVSAIPVIEGQQVKAGQLLIALDANEANALVLQAQAAVLQAEARLRQMRTLSLPTAIQAREQAAINLANARHTYARTRALQAQGFIGASQLDDVQQKLDLAISQLRSAELQVLSNAADGSETQMAKAALAQAQATLSAARARQTYLSIKAPVDGILIARDVEQGDVVQIGKALMVLSPVGKTQLVVQIDEKNLAMLALGQAALASADAFPNQRFRASVSFINPAVDAQRGSVEVKLDVAQPPSSLRQDMTISVDIEVAHRTGVLVVPIRAIHDLDSAAPWVLKILDHRAVRQPVKLGLRGSDALEVLSGVQADDRLVPNSLTVVPGHRVHEVTNVSSKVNNLSTTKG